MLILQGLNDAMIDPQTAQAFAQQPGTRGRVRLLTYAGLGHSVGRAASAQEDNLPPVAARPLDDMAAWLRKTLRK